jgi:riboflavin kinase/FMN adenylyltransferase
MTSKMTHEPCSATIGFFDGVHKGHRYIISQLKDDAAKHGIKSTVITFRQHPRQVLHKDYIPKLLTTCCRKEELLKETGVDNVVMLDFTHRLSALSARDFMVFMRQELNVRRLLIGYDNRFGHNRDKGFSDYQEYGSEIGIDVENINAFNDNGLTVSSSMIRRLLNNGNIDAANQCLGYKYGFDGTVVHGYGEGKKLGFPTANLHIADEQLIPKRGVYAVMVETEGFDGEFMGMMNIGNRPTYGEFNDSLEVNIIDFDADLYNKKVHVNFVKRIRDDKKFASIEQLRQQIIKDREETIKILKK